MTWYIILALLIAFGLYLLYSNKSKRVNIQSVSGQNMHDHNSPNHSDKDHADHNQKKGHGCC